ncbi:transposase [Nioella sp. MMSF_3534]|uniref:transposase n=1 Tax=Nioella sp. MMSF_3534 TaxID=3046720 RepID=UPI003531B300
MCRMQTGGLKPLKTRGPPPEKLQQGQPMAAGSEQSRADHCTMPCRAMIEIMFGRFNDGRRLASRYDPLATVFHSAIALAATVIHWRQDLTLADLACEAGSSTDEEHLPGDEA